MTALCGVRLSHRLQWRTNGVREASRGGSVSTSFIARIGLGHPASIDITLTPVWSVLPRLAPRFLNRSSLATVSISNRFEIHALPAPEAHARLYPRSDPWPFDITTFEVGKLAGKPKPGGNEIGRCADAAPRRPASIRRVWIQQQPAANAKAAKSFATKTTILAFTAAVVTGSPILQAKISRWWEIR